MRLAKVKIDAEQAIACRLQMQGIPTLVVFRGAKKCRENGVMDEATTVSWARNVKS